MLMVVHVLPTVTTIALTFRAVAKRHLRRRFARQPACQALVRHALRHLSRPGLKSHAPMAMPDVLPDVAAEEQKIVSHGRNNHRPRHPISDDKSNPVSD